MGAFDDQLRGQPLGPKQTEQDQRSNERRWSAPPEAQQRVDGTSQPPGRVRHERPEPDVREVVDGLGQWGPVHALPHDEEPVHDTSGQCRLGDQLREEPVPGIFVTGWGLLSPRPPSRAHDR